MQLQQRCFILQHHNHYDRRTSCDFEDDFTSTTSTSRVESATCPSYHNHDHRHPQSSTVLHLRSQSGPENFGHTLTSVSLSTSNSWTSPTMQRNLLQQTSRCSRHQQAIDNIQRLHSLHKHVKTSEMNKHYLQQIQHVVMTLSSLEIYNKYNETLTHNKYFKMRLPQQYVEQVNFWVTSLCIQQSQTANQTIYFVDFREQTSVGRCFDN